MKKLQLIFKIFLLVSLTLFSCKKDNDSSNNSNNSNTNSSCLHLNYSSGIDVPDSILNVDQSYINRVFMLLKVDGGIEDTIEIQGGLYSDENNLRWENYNSINQPYEVVLDYIYPEDSSEMAILETGKYGLNEQPVDAFINGSLVHLNMNCPGYIHLEYKSSSGEEYRTTNSTELSTYFHEIIDIQHTEGYGFPDFDYSISWKIKGAFNAELINDDNPNDKKILEGKYQLYLLTTPI